MRVARVSVCARRSDMGSDAKADERAAQVVELSAALSRHGHPVTVHTAWTGADPAPSARDEQPLAHLKDFAERLARHVDTDRQDILHSHDGPSGMVAALVGRTYGIPVVHTYHELDAHSPRDDRSSIERAVGRVAARIVTASSAEVFELVRIGVPRAKISIVPPGVDVDHFSVTGSRVNRHLSLRRIIARSLVMTDRGLGDLIDALPAIPNTELVIPGDDDQRAGWLRERAAQHGVADRVVLTGRVDREQLPALLRSADLAACVPRGESLGLVVLQAMACGLPVLATGVGEHTDIVEDGITGALIPPRQPAAIAATATRLLRDPGWLRAMGASACDRVRGRYTWDRVAQETAHIYLRAVDGPTAELGRIRTSPS